MRFSDILHYVQNNQDKAKRIEKMIEQAKSQLHETLDAMLYPDALFFTSQLVRYVNAYLDERSPVEVYRSIVSWEFDDSRKPYCIRATLNATAFTGVDRASQKANIVILIERVANVANARIPKGMPRTAKLEKSDVIELTGHGDVKAAEMKRCMFEMRSQQKTALSRTSKMH